MGYLIVDDNSEWISNLVPGARINGTFRGTSECLRGIYCTQVTVLVCNHSSYAAGPPNRPYPLLFHPPCGKTGSSCTVRELMWTALKVHQQVPRVTRARGTHPDSICLATRSPLKRLSVKTADVRPYSVSLASATASSSVSTTIRETVGPNDSAE